MTKIELTAELNGECSSVSADVYSDGFMIARYAAEECSEADAKSLVKAAMWDLDIHE